MSEVRRPENLINEMDKLILSLKGNGQPIFQIAETIQRATKIGIRFFRVDAALASWSEFPVLALLRQAGASTILDLRVTGEPEIVRAILKNQPLKALWAVSVDAVNCRESLIAARNAVPRLEYDQGGYFGTRLFCTSLLADLPDISQINMRFGLGGDFKEAVIRPVKEACEMCFDGAILPYGYLKEKDEIAKHRIIVDKVANKEEAEKAIAESAYMVIIDETVLYSLE